jgi:hypothetical protein
MSTAAIIIIVAAIAAVAVGLIFFVQKRRSDRLHTQFGPEYGRALEEYGDRRKAESELERRQKRFEKFEIRALTPEERERFSEAWRVDQARFVDEPKGAVIRAYELVNEVMHYRVACEIVKRQESGQANTEDLRNAMVNYRKLFEELLGASVSQSQEVRR